MGWRGALVRKAMEQLAVVHGPFETKKLLESVRHGHAFRTRKETQWKSVKQESTIPGRLTGLCR